MQKKIQINAIPFTLLGPPGPRALLTVNSWLSSSPGHGLGCLHTAWGQVGSQLGQSAGRDDGESAFTSRVPDILLSKWVADAPSLPRSENVELQSKKAENNREKGEEATGNGHTLNLARHTKFSRLAHWYPTFSSCVPTPISTLMNSSV